jgi:sensor c-di-GMP phosphodiesterase-like protein
VVAEGVETQEQASFLRQRAPGIVYQGYLFGRPEPEADWLARAAQARSSAE